MNFVITLSKLSVDPQGDSRVDCQLFDNIMMKVVNKTGLTHEKLTSVVKLIE